MIKLANIKNDDHYDVYIGRSGRGLTSKWGNPFSVKECGSRKVAIGKYESWILNQPELMSSLHELDDKTLGCFCYPDKDCHGSVLIKLRRLQMFTE